MQSWSLNFEDSRMEKQYRSEAFRSSALVLVAGATTLGVVSILLDLAYPAKMATPFGLGCLVMSFCCSGPKPLRRFR
jgi:formate-dependent nitrite reductase membrane component NrfD